MTLDFERIALCFVDDTGRLSIINLYETVDLAKAARGEHDYISGYGRLELRQATVFVDDEECYDEET